jgi:hypothetical protein
MKLRHVFLPLQHGESTCRIGTVTSDAPTAFTTPSTSSRNDRLSLKTREEAEAKRFIAAKNPAADTPQLNRAMATVYASAASPQLMERTWREVMDAYVNKSVATTRPRVERAFRSEPFKVLGRIKVNETDPTAFWAVLNHKRAGNSTNH